MKYLLKYANISSNLKKSIGTPLKIINITNVTNKDEDDIIECESYLIITMNTYVVPLIILFGLIGNLLAAFTFLTTKLRKRSSSIYLGSLSLSDFCYLLVLSFDYLSYESKIDLYNVKILCQLFVFIGSACSNLSVWLIVAFTTERVIAVKYPLKRQQICTVSRAKLITFSIFLFALFSQIYIFWTSGLIVRENFEECEMLPEYKDFMKIVNYLDTIFAFIIPLIVIIIFNSTIARSLMNFRGNSTDGLKCGDNSFISYVSSSGEDQSGNSGRDNCKIGLAHYKRNVLIVKSQRNITKMLLLVSTAFILLNVPSYALRLYVFTMGSLFDLPVYSSTVWCCQQIGMVLFYMNSSINFLLYSMCGISFRTALIGLIKSKAKQVRGIFGKSETTDFSE